MKLTLEEIANTSWHSYEHQASACASGSLVSEIAIPVLIPELIRRSIKVDRNGDMRAK